MTVTRLSLFYRHETLPGKNGKPDLVVALKKPKLKPGAVPCLFPGLPGYLSAQEPKTSRADPSARHTAAAEKLEAKNEAWLRGLQIHCLQDIRDGLKEHILKRFENLHWCEEPELKSLLLYQFASAKDIATCPTINFGIRVTESLQLFLWIHGEAVDLDWILSNGSLDQWSQLENIISRYQSPNDLPSPPSKSSASLHAKSERIACEVEELEREENVDSHNCGFLADQVRLLGRPPKGRRYSITTIITAFTLYFLSSRAYGYVRSAFLTLPSVSWLRKLSSHVGCKPVSGLSCDNFLRLKAGTLKSNELIVNLLLDEVYVKPGLSFKNSDVVGTAQNDPSQTATTIQCFMISSLQSSNRDVIALVPVRKLTAEYLLQLTSELLKKLSSAGFRVISIISDNNRINQKMFRLLSDSSGAIAPYINDPVHPSYKIFLLFDTVHILKSIRNNWLNMKNYGRTLSFPGFSDHSSVMHASMADLETMFKLEQDKLLKKAPRLTWKALHPHPLERQKVTLALKIFDATNSVALQCVAPSQTEKFINWKATAEFINIIATWFTIVNVKHPYKGRNTRNPNAEPIISDSDKNLQWLDNMVSWLNHGKKRNELTGDGFFTRDTYLSLTHTTSTLIQVAQYILQELKWDFVLLGKFQTDDLESRFGQYRQLCGGNTLVSVNQVLEGEKKLRLKSLLSLKSSTKGTISIKQLLLPESDGSVLGSPNLDSNFLDNFSYEDLSLEACDLHVLLYVAGYVSKVGQAKSACASCRACLGSREQLSAEIEFEQQEYMTILNRGGLMYPSTMLFQLVQAAFSIFAKCVSRDVEPHFLVLCNHKEHLLELNRRYWDECDMFADVPLVCDNCLISRESIYQPALSSFFNILLANYTRAHNEQEQYNESIRKKARKF